MVMESTWNCSMESTWNCSMESTWNCSMESKLDMPHSIWNPVESIGNGVGFHMESMMSME